MGSTLHNGPIEVLLVKVSGSRLASDRPWYVVFCEWGVAYKTSLGKSSTRSSVLSRYLTGLLLYVQRHINVNKMF